MIFKHPVGRRPGSDRSDDRIGRAVGEAVDRWQAARAARHEAEVVVDAPPAAENPSPQDVLRPLPRRERVVQEVPRDIQPRVMRLARPFRVSLLFCFRRLFVWLYGICWFLFGIVWDIVKRRNTIDRRAVRLRLCCEKIGGTFLKLGQQASIRIDIIPYRYCIELTRLLDTAEPFPTDQAIAMIEADTGRPLAETFTAFDPTPIGSASIACVYQARLHTGEAVAVKVRRPGVGETFMADLRVLGWLFRFMEMTTIVRPGYTGNVLQELRETLLEELDFYKEARFQELFRRRARKSGRSFFTAPKVYPQHSSERIIVQEFVGGVWLSELIAAIEQDSKPGLAHIRKLNIDPKLVARRLLWASHWGMWENIFFHADPHPANIIVQADSRLVFIDFGAAGTLTESRRLAMHELFAREREEDLEGISRVALTLLEPLPPMDTEKVIHAIEKVFWDAVIAQRSAHSQWWEKTSANLWLGFFKVTNQFKIPMGVDHVRMIRATLLYDTLAARLDNQIDLGAQYRSFMRDSGRKAKRRLQRKLQKRLTNGLTSSDYVKIERLMHMGDRALYLAQRVVDLRTFNFGALIGKFVSVMILLISLAFQLLVLTGAIVLFVHVAQWIAGTLQETWLQTLRAVVTNPWYIGGLAAVLLINIRRMLFRLSDQEIR